MPNEGDVRYGKEIGILPKRKYDTKPATKFKYVICPDCLKGRWVTLWDSNLSTFTGRCKYCSGLFKTSTCMNQKGMLGPASISYKNGRTIGCGYVYIKLIPDDFFFSMATKSHYVLEHRLVVAKSLNRCLHKWEIVHHKNHIRDDNRIENLQLISEGQHNGISRLESIIAIQNKRIKELEARIKGLEF